MAPGPVTLERPSLFQRVADYVSAAMGRPTNILVWLALVVGWTLLFASGLVNPSGSFLPAWFSSQGFNFPLNLVTTVAELFIGFLVAAAANRSERNLEMTLAAIAAQEEQIGVVEDGLRADLTANTALTQQVHDLTQQVHALVATHTVVVPAPAPAPVTARGPAPAAATAARDRKSAPADGQPGR